MINLDRNTLLFICFAINASNRAHCQICILKTEKDRTHLRVCEFGAIHVWPTKLHRLSCLVESLMYLLMANPYKYLGILLTCGLHCI